MAADTLKDNETNKELIAEMLRDAEKAEVPSELASNPIIHKGDDELVAPMILKEMTNAGYLWIYDTRTGERVPVIRYMLQQKLNQKRPDGSYRFTARNPHIEVKRGEVKCLLHPDHENRPHYNELGFRTCPKSNITNPYQLRQHMIKKHPQEWAAIEQERIEKEREEDRALQRLLLASQANKLAPEPEEKTKKRS